MSLFKVIDRQIKIDKNQNNFTIASCTKTKKIYNIDYQNDAMRAHIDRYGDVIHIDVTYCTNELNFALYFFSVKDGFGKKKFRLFSKIYSFSSLRES